MKKRNIVYINKRNFLKKVENLPKIRRNRGEIPLKIH